MIEKKKRRDTSLECEGAEFLVLARLLLERIDCYKAYVNYPGYDLVAVDPERGASARISVKSRFRTDWDGFIIKNFKCDFVVLVALNRGFGGRRGAKGAGLKEPEFYVMPVKYVRKVRDINNSWGKIVKKRLVGIEEFRDKWSLVKEHLARPKQLAGKNGRRRAAGAGSTRARLHGVFE